MATVRQVLIALLSLAGLACSRAPDARPLALVRQWTTPDAVAAIDMALDGQTILLGSRLGESSIWTAPWKLSVIFDRVDEPLLAARFSSDGHVMFARARGSLEVRSSEGAITRELRVPGDATRKHAAISPSGRFVALDTSAYEVEPLRLAAHGELARGLTSLALAADHALLLVGQDDARLTVLPLDGGDAVLLRAPAPVRAGAISRDGRVVAAATADALTVWPDTSAAPSCTLRSPARISLLRFGGSARWLAYAAERSFGVLDVTTCELRVTLPLQEGATATTLDSDLDLVAVGDTRGNLYAWDVYNHRLAGRATPFEASISHLRVNATARTLLAASNQGQGAAVKLLQLSVR